MALESRKKGFRVIPGALESGRQAVIGTDDFCQIKLKFLVKGRCLVLSHQQFEEKVQEGHGSRRRSTSQRA